MASWLSWTFGYTFGPSFIRNEMKQGKSNLSSFVSLLKVRLSEPLLFRRPEALRSALLSRRDMSRRVLVAIGETKER